MLFLSQKNERVVDNLGNELVNGKCHNRFWQNKRCLDLEAECRAEAYNLLVDAIQRATKVLTPKFIADSTIDCFTIDVEGNTSRAWNIYKEEGCNIYQIDLTYDGLLVEGTKSCSELSVSRRVLNICHIKSCDSLAYLHTCYPKDQFLDYQTMLYLCDRILDFCTKFNLCDCIECIEERLSGLPLETMGKIHQFQY